MLQIQEQQDFLDNCDRASQLIQALLAKPPLGKTSDASTYANKDSETEASHTAPASSTPEHSSMDHELLQRRLSSVHACSSQAAATMEVLEASLQDRRATLSALQGMVL